MERGSRPTTKSLSRDAWAACGLCELRAVIRCQTHGPEKANAGCLGTSLLWVICGLGGVGSQGAVGWSKLILSGRRRFRIVLVPSLWSVSKDSDHSKASSCLPLAQRRPPSAQETLQLRVAWVAHHQKSLLKCTGQAQAAQAQSCGLLLKARPREGAGWRRLRSHWPNVCDLWAGWGGARETWGGATDPSGPMQLHNWP